MLSLLRRPQAMHRYICVSKCIEVRERELYDFMIANTYLEHDFIWIQSQDTNTSWIIVQGKDYHMAHVFLFRLFVFLILVDSWQLWHAWRCCCDRNWCDSTGDIGWQLNLLHLTSWKVVPKCSMIMLLSSTTNNDQDGRCILLLTMNHMLYGHL